jgi:hypothetical protein
MILAPIYQAIYDRMKADTGAGGLYNGGAWNLITGGAYTVFAAPTPITGPYLVFSVAMQQQNTTTGDEFLCTATFNLYDRLNESSQTAYIGTSILPALDRLHGNAVLQNGRVPTYGFNRHRLVLPTNGYSAVASTCIVEDNDATIVSENVVMATMKMTFRVSAIAANP